MRYFINKKRINAQPFWKWGRALILFSVFFVSCGSSSGGGVSSSRASGGVGGTGVIARVSKGTLTGFGRVIVNGVAFKVKSPFLKKGETLFAVIHYEADCRKGLSLFGFAFVARRKRTVDG